MNWLTRWRQRRYELREAEYREQIKALTPSKPLDLPAVKPLKAEFVNPPKSNVTPFPSRFV